ncbi:oleate hydratase [Lichenifustis flavocetrariae]|uniref:Oleate hydratase n=1 Tax=Lichenifustis flavocetrariae TaxID=2949735 RepID=A0AA41ZA71_9HYPH|nr:oleate hydratase [Lichenifustis flavocetrariae]MCW6512132.1 oleate hydratase [Lichenifustis flavocetrariae]
MNEASQPFTEPAPPAPGAARRSIKAYLVGGGIASMAAAAFLIRDGDLLGHDITIFEETDKVGGSLDGAGSPKVGYVLRGGRMIERKYLCTYDLFSSIPTLDESKSVTDEIFAWNETMKTSSKSRLIRNGQRQTAPDFGLSERHILTIERLAIEPEGLLGASTIADQFDPTFFKTNFWFMWCTTFAFQPWHSAVEFKRYLVRFAHMVSGFDRLEGIMRTVYNQYDSMVRPLHKWLDARGVVFARGTRVIDLHFRTEPDGTSVTRIDTEREGWGGQVEVASGDLVLVTLGSMTEASSLGSMNRAPSGGAETAGTKSGTGAWALWKKIADDRPEFGNPSVFSDHVGRSKWVSFTTTLYDLTLLRVMRDLTGNVPGEGGLITFPESSWLMSIVIPHQPHFIDQPADVGVFWGYGLKVDDPGDFVRKPMAACTGREIMTEMLGHLHVTTDLSTIIETCLCVPCMMPFITSQFLPRNKGDRPDVIPAGTKDIACIGQFCEMPEDVVFTVEYSIRSAQTAVYKLLGLKREPPPVYKGRFDPRVLFNAFLALHDIHA